MDDASVDLAKTSLESSGDKLLDSACVPIWMILCSFALFLKICSVEFSFKKESPLNRCEDFSAKSLVKGCGKRVKYALSKSIESLILI